jgi:hypothetical protein
MELLLVHFQKHWLLIKMHVIELKTAPSELIPPNVKLYLSSQASKRAFALDAT